MADFNIKFNKSSFDFEDLTSQSEYFDGGLLTELSVVTSGTKKSQFVAANTGTLLGTVRNGENYIIFSLTTTTFVSVNIIAGDYVNIVGINYQILSVKNLGGTDDISGVSTIQVNLTENYLGEDLVNGNISNFGFYNNGNIIINRTELSVTYPNIILNSPITLELFDERIFTLGSNFTFVIVDEVNLPTLIDGTYKFNFKGFNGATEIFSVTKYFIYDFNVLNCQRLRIDKEIDKQCSDNWLEIGLISAMLDTAKREAALDRFTASQEIMDHLAKLCNEC